MKTPEECLNHLGPQASPPERRPLAVCSDFDGTISCRDLSLATLEDFGRPEWRHWEERWLRGEISSIESIRNQFATVEAREQDVLPLYEQSETSPGFEEFVAHCREREIPIFVLSDGLDIYIRVILRRLGMDDVPLAANHAEIGGSGFRVGFPHRNDSCRWCGTCKCSFVRALAGRFDHVVYVGDGHSDRCAAKLADTLYAKDVLQETCAKAGRDHIPFQDFRDVLADFEKRFSA